MLSNALKNNSHYLSSFGLLIEDIICNASLFNQLFYSHVKREGNKVVHNLARHSISIFDFSVWVEIVPSPFVSLVLAVIANFLNKVDRLPSQKKKKNSFILFIFLEEYNTTKNL